MSCRGIVQLQRVKLTFCDWGGSSQGVRNFFKQDEFYNFVNKNFNINFEFHLRRGRHPFITAIFANGWEKDISLRNMKQDDVLDVLNHIKSNIGRISLPHAGHKVTSFNKSIQGKWESNMWNTYPKHDVLEFMKMKDHKLTWDQYGAERQNIKKKPWAANTRLVTSTRQTLNEL